MKYKITFTHGPPVFIPYYGVPNTSPSGWLQFLGEMPNGDIGHIYIVSNYLTRSVEVVDDSHNDS